jgi:hypothetical protein
LTENKTWQGQKLLSNVLIVIRVKDEGRVSPKLIMKFCAFNGFEIKLKTSITQKIAFLITFKKWVELLFNPFIIYLVLGENGKADL